MSINPSLLSLTSILHTTLSYYERRDYVPTYIEERRRSHELRYVALGFPSLFQVNLTILTPLTRTIPKPLQRVIITPSMANHQAQ